MQQRHEQVESDKWNECKSLGNIKEKKQEATRNRNRSTQINRIKRLINCNNKKESHKKVEIKAKIKSQKVKI